MRVFSFLFLFYFTIGCKTQEKTTSNNTFISQDVNCPDTGNCTLEIFKNANLNVLTDAFGNIYPKIIAGDKWVIKYELKKPVLENVADSNYSEFIYFEVDKNFKQITLKNETLQNTKMLFGRICFCRESMGYFNVTQGNLSLTKNKKEVQIKLQFEVNKVPQIITQINGNILF